jgi:hypothetical protein
MFLFSSKSRGREPKFTVDRAEYTQTKVAKIQYDTLTRRHEPRTWIGKAKTGAKKQQHRTPVTQEKQTPSRHAYNRFSLAHITFKKRKRKAQMMVCNCV